MVIKEKSSVTSNYFFLFPSSGVFSPTESSGQYPVSAQKDSSIYLENFFNSNDSSERPFRSSDLIQFWHLQRINTLVNYRLKDEFIVLIEFDEEYFLAKLIDIPIYATGNTANVAIDNLKEEIECLYEELLEDDDFSEEWLSYKNFLVANLIPLDEEQ